MSKCRKVKRSKSPGLRCLYIDLQIPRVTSDSPRAVPANLKPIKPQAQSQQTLALQHFLCHIPASKQTPHRVRNNANSHLHLKETIRKYPLNIAKEPFH